MTGENISTLVKLILALSVFCHLRTDDEKMYEQLNVGTKLTVVSLLSLLIADILCNI